MTAMHITRSFVLMAICMLLIGVGRYVLRPVVYITATVFVTIGTLAFCVLKLLGIALDWAILKMHTWAN
jgi:hypothetical protein